MKPRFLCLLAFVAFTAGAHAQSSTPTQEPVLSPGKYLLITAGKNNISVQDCEVTKENAGTFIKFSPPAGHPEYALKPIPVLVADNRVLFSVGTSDYVTPSVERYVLANSVYTGQIARDEVHGTVTGVKIFQEPVTEQFCLRKL